MQPRALLLPDTREFPNSWWPVLVYSRAVAPHAELAAEFEALFASHGWTGAWQNGLYRRHHYHSTAHEVLGVCQGSVDVRWGGAAGPVITLRAGDVAVVPAGVAHKNEGQSSDFSVVGAYPSGTSPDLLYGNAGERPEADARIASLPRPDRDPVQGRDGPLLRLWLGRPGSRS